MSGQYQTVMEDPDVHFFGSKKGISSIKANQIKTEIRKAVDTRLNEASIYGKRYNKILSNTNFNHKYFSKEFTSNTANTLHVYVDKVEIEADEQGVVDPLQYITRSKSCFYLRGEQPLFYLKFSSLLEYIQKAIIPYIKSNSSSNPLFSIDFDPKSKMYSIPNQISLDPRVCLVRNDKFQKRKNSFAKILGGNVSAFRVSDLQEGKNKDKYINSAYVMNIYLNFNFIISSLDSNKDVEGNVNLYGLISSICNGLNEALGGINNLEPVVDKLSNRLKIIDSTPIPGITKKTKDPSYALEMYGYNPKNNLSNFVRDIKLKTTITPEYATMVTVGATAGGYVKGVEATAFSNWNEGLTDRFNSELINNVSAGIKNEAEINYVKKVLNEISLCYGFSGIKLAGGSDDGNGNTYLRGNIKLNEEAIDSNIGVVTEFYRFLQADNKVGNSIGFIPFKLGLTLDGISGLKIYNKLHIDSRFLPSNYGKTLDLIITGISHKLSNDDWTTEIEATAMPEPKVLSQGALNNISWGAVEDIIDSTIELSSAGGGNATVNEISNYTPSSGTPLLEKAVRDQFTWLYDFANTPALDFKAKILSHEGNSSAAIANRANSAEISGYCAGYSYNGILKLKEHIDKKSTGPIKWEWKGSGNAYANAHLDKIQATNGGNFYTKSYVGFMSVKDARVWIADKTRNWNYGDVVNYRLYQNKPGVNKTTGKKNPGGFHTQVYTGDIFSNSNFWNLNKNKRDKSNTKNSGWSTSNSTNYSNSWVYGPNSYGGGDGGYHIYVFKVNPEYLI